MSVLDAVLRLLKREEEQLERELSGITAAIAAFRESYAYGKGEPRVSAARRTRIVAAPKARSAKAQKGRKVVPIRSKGPTSSAAGKKASSAQKARLAKVKAKKSA